MRRRIPSLNWLRVFEAAARFESFARAAEALNLSAPAVSQQIRDLEAALGEPLFERGPRSVRLTEAGRAFLPVVAGAVGSIEASAASLFGGAEARPLTVRASALFACSWLAPRLGGFMAAHPEVRLTLSSAVSDAAFDRPGAELSITFARPPRPREEADALFGERISAVAAPTVAAGIASPEDLLDHVLVDAVGHRANWGLLLPERRPGLREPRLVLVDTTLAALAMAASGGAVALARAPASDHLAQALGLAPVLPGLTAQGVEIYRLIRPERSRLSPAARAFRDWLLDACAPEAGARGRLEAAAKRRDRTRRAAGLLPHGG